MAYRSSLDALRREYLALLEERDRLSAAGGESEADVQHRIHDCAARIDALVGSEQPKPILKRLDVRVVGAFAIALVVVLGALFVASAHDRQPKRICCPGETCVRVNDLWDCPE